MDIDEMIRKTLLEQEVRNVLSSQIGSSRVIEYGNKFVFPCNVCGDSKSDSTKKRAAIMKGDEWAYVCKNCGYTTHVADWLYKYFPMNHRMYNKEVFRESMRMRKRRLDKTSTEEIVQIVTEPVQTFFKQEVKKEDVVDAEAERIKTFKSISLFPEAVEYCVSRKIPEDVYSKWFFCQYGEYRNRIIITFRKPNGKIYYYQGRSLDRNTKLRYMSKHTVQGENNVYNYYSVDKTKWVTILEGPVDSIFVVNAVAMTGLKMTDVRIQDFPMRRFMLDNDESGKKFSVDLLLQGQYVFNWKRFLRDYDYEGHIKDVNDFVRKNTNGITKLTYEIIDTYFTNRLLDKIDFV